MSTRQQITICDGIMNPWEYIQGHGDYTITPKPESTTTLYTPFNFQARFIMADNLESHINNLNNMSGAVQVLNTNAQILHSEINQIESQIQGIIGIIKMLSADISTMQIVMLAGAAISFGAGSAMALPDAGIDLGAAGSAITFGGDGTLNLDADGLEIGGLSMDADGLELEDLSISEGGVSIGEEGSGTYTKLGEGTIEAGKFHLTMTSDNAA
jgi:hypothetical protein